MFKKNLAQYYGLHTKYYQEVSDVKLNPSTLNVYIIVSQNLKSTEHIITYGTTK